MWLNKSLPAGFLIVASACQALPKHSAELTKPCPERPGHWLKNVDVFDGPIEEMAILMADVNKGTKGYWRLAYVYEAGRIVNLRCKYEDNQSYEVKLTKKIDRCNYLIDNEKKMTLSCK